MAIENVQQLLGEQLGKNPGTEVFDSSSGALIDKDYYCVYFPVESAISSIAAASVTNVTKLQTTVPAGTTLFMNITAITLGGGIGIGYKE
tara:strand:+ start:19 stop:288 length:270 start_codon:yes stop_codon:yes gene_type:complete